MTGPANIKGRVFPPDQTAELSTPAGRKPLRADVAAATESLTEGRSEYEPPAKVGVWEEGAIINDRYTLERRLGSGSMGEVFLASDRLLKKQVALKVLRPDLAKSRETVRRFLREVALAHSVTHPNVVRIYDTGEADSLPFFSMEYLQGQTLEDLIEASRALEADDVPLGDPPMTLREIREISFEILSGLAAAHDAGIVHRDLKPANVLLTHRGAIVMDFGVAGFDAPTPGVRPNPAEARSLVRTEAGTIFGSPAYMAPELWEGSPATIQSDLYSFGVMLYQMLTGRLPIEAPNAKQFLVKLKSEKPAPIRTLRKDAPWNLVFLVSRCMDHDPERRPPTATAAANFVAPLARRWRWLIIVAVLAVLTAAATLVLSRGNERHREFGLPDTVAAADLDAFVRAYDTGDLEAARRLIERLEQRAPTSAAVVFWRATLEHELDDEPGRLDYCERAGYEPGDTPEQWTGSALWQEQALRACAEGYSISSPMRALLDPDSVSRLPESWLPVAIYESLLPRLEAAREPGDTLLYEAETTLRRLDSPPDFSEGPALATRWQLARVDLRLALGMFDEARATLDELLEAHPQTPLVLARAANFHALIGERELAARWAEALADLDPRPAVRMLLDQGRLRDAAALMDRYAISRGTHPHLHQLVDMWCGYAYRFQIEPAPARCGSISPGLVHSLWLRAQSGIDDQRAMSILERAIINQQADLNSRECLIRGANLSVITQAAAPFETYLRQLDITSALCSGQDGNLNTARRLAEGLVAQTPADPWALLIDAQVDEAYGSSTSAEDKRRRAAERWRNADDDLPLIRDLRRLLAIPDEDAAAEDEDEDVLEFESSPVFGQSRSRGGDGERAADTATEEAP
ncbi:serine/threonine protein kinase [Pseudenhygromyxa sp. WMMC2535]|uniref:protein kinase domain-containing protein n=1 Tax=Pseudenhygromyxa sp. WMMC2535 TaxID=2712867 RepID=UPI001551914F|nr:serine/threonine protein kinase [Pseudenhygromyxa sp. WMMC2535]